MSAFTLLELIVVIVVLGVLAALALPSFGAVIDRARESTEEVTFAAVMREAQALAQLRGEALATEADIAAALGDLSARAEGVQAYTDASAGIRVYAQSEWADNWESGHDGRRAFVYASDPGNNRVGFATISETDALECVATRFQSGTQAASFRIPVTSALDCDGLLALGGPVAPVVSTAGETIEAGFLAVGTESDFALDDVEVTNNASTTFLADDFNRANGELSSPWSILSGVLDAPTIDSNRAVGTADSVTHLAYHPVPAAGSVRVSATLAAVPTYSPGTDDIASVLVADLDTFSAEAQLQVGYDTDGTRILRHSASVPSAVNDYVFAYAGTIEQGDEMAVARVNAGVSRAYVNGTLRSTINRSQIGAFTGTVTGAADPSACWAHAYRAGATNPDLVREHRGSSQVAADGSFTVYAPASSNMKVGVWCPVAGTRFSNGASISSAPAYLPVAGASTDAGTFSMS